MTTVLKSQRQSARQRDLLRLVGCFIVHIPQLSVSFVSTNKCSTYGLNYNYNCDHNNNNNEYFMLPLLRKCQPYVNVDAISSNIACMHVVQFSFSETRWLKTQACRADSSYQRNLMAHRLQNGRHSPLNTLH